MTGEENLDQGELSIALRRSGGLLPGNTLETSLDAEELGDEEAGHVRSLVAAADIPALAARSPITGVGADMYQYELLVRCGDEAYRILVRGSGVPDQLVPVIELMERRTRVSGRGSRRA